MKSNRIFISWLRWPLFIRIGVIILCLILLFGQIIYILEPKQFTSVFEGIWWAVVTVSTVGYGDYVPHTPLGQATRNTADFERSKLCYSVFRYVISGRIQQTASLH